MTHTRQTRPITAESPIECITVTPGQKRHETPILFLHGMWHAAWVWEGWQARFADLGWESHAISLPGHGASPAQGSVRFSTMGKYLTVLADEIARLPTPPVVIGHSMGGALIQWYLKKVADDLPAAVLLSSWTAHSTYADGLWPLMRRDPVGGLLIAATLSSHPYIRTPRRAAQALLSPGSAVDPAELHSKLCEESALVLNQHNPPFWRPKRSPATPMLWVSAEADAVVTEAGARKSAKFYGADYHPVPDDGHNLMMESHEADTAKAIADWLEARALP